MADANEQTSLNLEMRGVSGELRANVELMLTLYQQRDEARLTKARIKRLYQRSFDEIKQALKPFGFFRPEILGEIKEVDSTVEVSFDIDPGEAIKLTRLNINIKGAAVNDTAFIALIDNLPLREKAILDQRAYSETKLKMQNLAASRGYFNAHFVEHKILVDLEAFESEIIIIFDSGKRYKFGEVSISASMPSVDLINRYIRFERGDYYSVNALVDLQVALNDSDYFQSVEISGLTDSIVGDEVPIKVNLEPRLKRRYNLGFGYGTDTGARGRVGLDAPIINDKGHRFNTSFMISELKDTLTAHYLVPVLDPRTDQLAYTASYNDEETESSSSESFMLGVGLIHARGSWRETISLKYQEERFEVGEDTGQSTLLMPGITWTRIWGKERIYTRKGASLSLDLRAASQFLLSDVDFVEGKAHAKLIRSFGTSSRFIARGTLGANFANDFETIPSSVRFFAGGDNSVRGYKYNSLGPQDAGGTVIGGRAIMVASVEYEHKLLEKWGAAIFYDIGNALDFFDEPLKRGAGVGIRWKSPVGPMRLDLAFALSDPGTPWRIHLNLGPDL